MTEDISKKPSSVSTPHTIHHSLLEWFMGSKAPAPVSALETEKSPKHDTKNQGPIHQQQQETGENPHLPTTSLKSPSHEGSNEDQSPPGETQQMPITEEETTSTTRNKKKTRNQKKTKKSTI